MRLSGVWKGYVAAINPHLVRTNWQKCWRRYVKAPIRDSYVINEYHITKNSYKIFHFFLDIKKKCLPLRSANGGTDWWKEGLRNFFKKNKEKIWRLRKSYYLCGPKREGRSKPVPEREVKEEKFIENNRKTSSIVLENYDFNTRYWKSVIPLEVYTSATIGTRVTGARNLE